MTDLQRPIRNLRISRAVDLAAAVLLAVVANNLAAYSLGAAFALAVPVAILLTAVVVQTSTIRRWKTEERAARLELAVRASGAAVAGTTATADPELGPGVWVCAHPDAEPVDLSTGERVAWVCANPECGAGLPAGWAPPAQVTGSLTASGGTLSATAALSGSGSISAKALQSGDSRRLTDGEAKDAAEAAQHFAQLARVGRESCIGFCPICAERHDPRGGSGRVTVVYRSGGVIAGAGGGGGTSASARHLEPPEGAHGYRLDSAGRKWCRVAGDSWWIKPSPDGPWYRQDKPEGGGQR